MFGNNTKKIYSEKMAHQELRHSLLFPGFIAAISLIGTTYFIWQDGGFSSSAIIMVIFAGFWLVPVMFILVELRRSAKQKNKPQPNKQVKSFPPRV